MNNPILNSFPAAAQKTLAQPKTLTLVRNVLLVLLLLWCCITLARIFWLLIPSPELPQAPGGSPRNTLVSHGQTTAGGVDVEPLLAAQLFGALDANEPEPEAQPQDTIGDVEETKLNLTLKGVIKSSIAANSEAIIAHGREEKVFKVGDKLPGGSRVKLVQVDWDRVVIENAGNNEALKLFDENARPSEAAIPAGRAGPARVTSSSARAPISSTGDENQEAEPAESSNEPERRVVKRLPKSLAEVIKFSVARENGDIVGYKIRPGRDREAFSSLGLRANDVVIDINGIALNTSGAITQVYREMRTATSASVTLLRDGQSMSLSVELDTSE